MLGHLLRKLYFKWTTPLFTFIALQTLSNQTVSDQIPALFAQSPLFTVKSQKTIVFLSLSNSPSRQKHTFFLWTIYIRLCWRYVPAKWLVLVLILSRTPTFSWKYGNIIKTWHSPIHKSITSSWTPWVSGSCEAKNIPQFFWVFCLLFDCYPA